jgi:hypothetical protein
MHDRLGSRSLLLAVAAVAIMGAAALVVADPREPSDSGTSGVPPHIATSRQAPYVLPADASGYRYLTSSHTVMGDGRVDMRSVIVWPPRLDEQPTATVCVDYSSERNRCGPGSTNGVSLTRTFEGRPVVITLFGTAAAESVAEWQVMDLTTDPEKSSLFQQE